MVTQRYADLPASERVAVMTHTVKKGETVTTLAKRYGVTASSIRAANSSARGKRLKVGSTLKLKLFRQGQYVQVEYELPERPLLPGDLPESGTFAPMPLPGRPEAFRRMRG